LRSAEFFPTFVFVTPKTLFEQIQQLPIEERLKLVEDIWDSIAATPESVPIPDWHRAELDRRLADPAPEHLTWEQVQERLRKAE
jgi:putative addiction module component (TIGR02574 family)